MLNKLAVGSIYNVYLVRRAFADGIVLVLLDRFKSNQLISFLQQLISYNGFYDKQLDFVRLEMIQVLVFVLLSEEKKLSGNQPETVPTLGTLLG